ncbi:Short coiled-coil protein [Trichuris trichiura]|uniref:Short coiled-coil protein n=1 Tax=Trichuris trichiura TaxID=36087 RepID=A0A077ZBI5_TRITR|nr:Short coiled-coil protein [Trichuris trichiura]
MSAELSAMGENADFPLADESDEASLDGSQSLPKPAQPLPKANADDSEDREEKSRLISQILELQSTLEELSLRVDRVKEESLKLRSENEVLGQYIGNLMAASSVFQSANPKAKAKN